MADMIVIEQVKPLEPYKVELRFTDGTHKVVDLEPYLDGELFEPIRNDRALFRAVCIEHGALTWPNEADIDPELLYYGLPAWSVSTEPSPTVRPLERNSPPEAPVHHDRAEAG